MHYYYLTNINVQFPLVVDSVQGIFEINFYTFLLQVFPLLLLQNLVIGQLEGIQVIVLHVLLYLQYIGSRRQKIFKLGPQHNNGFL